MFLKFHTGKYTKNLPISEDTQKNRQAAGSNPSFVFLHFIPKIIQNTISFKHQNQLRPEYFEPYGRRHT